VDCCLPRGPEFSQFQVDPLACLGRTRKDVGELFVVRECGPVFSRSADCVGTVAAFGAARQGAVLGDIDTFALPPSFAEQFSLSDRLVNLNRSLHSMHGEHHVVQKRRVNAVLSALEVGERRATMVTAMEAVSGGWAPEPLGLLAAMRALTSRLAATVLFGDRHAENAQLMLLLDTYFQVRREASSANRLEEGDRELLGALGRSLDRALRRRLRECRRRPAGSSWGIMDRLATLAEGGESAFSEDELVGHGNILFVSSTEPIAVALTWILLILSQQPAIRHALREELGQTPEGTMPRPSTLSLLECVILESLRLLPPNAFMVRVTTRATILCGAPLPAKCEVVLCPFLAHREAATFERANEFLPSRWIGAPLPSSFVYFPFGAGGHACVGRGLAMYLLRTALSFLLQRYDVSLDGDQEIDWRIHIMFMPRTDPRIMLTRDGSTGPGGKLLGPVAELLGPGWP
jgi:cytochrome P450